MVKSRSEEVFHRRMLRFSAGPMRYAPPIVYHRLPDMLAMLCALGLVHCRLANLLSVLVGEFSVLSLEVFHSAPGVSKPAST